MEHIYIRYATYWYYEPTCHIEFDERESLKDEYCAGECDIHYLRIDTKEELIKAFKYLIKKDHTFASKRVQVNDFIKLLNDSNLGDTFFERFVENIKWYLKEAIPLYLLIKDRTFLFVTKGKNYKLVLLPFYKEHREFQKYLLQYCIDEDIKFKAEWFDISEKDIQAWRFEHDVNVLKDTLHTRQLELERNKRRVIKLEQELKDMREQLEALMNS